MRAVTLNLHDWSDEQARALRRTRVARGGFEVIAGCARRDGAAPRGRRTRSRSSASGKNPSGAPSRARSGRTTECSRASASRRARCANKSRPMPALRWTLKRIPQLAFVPLAALGYVLFWIPREVTAIVARETRASRGRGRGAHVSCARRFSFLHDLVRSAGDPVVVLRGRMGAGWSCSGAAVRRAEWPLAVGDSRRLTWDAVRRFFVLRTQHDRVAALRARQHALAEQLRSYTKERPSNPAAPRGRWRSARSASLDRAPRDAVRGR